MGAEPETEPRVLGEGMSEGGDERVAGCSRPCVGVAGGSILARAFRGLGWTGRISRDLRTGIAAERKWREVKTNQYEHSTKE